MSQYILLLLSPNADDVCPTRDQISENWKLKRIDAIRPIIVNWRKLPAAVKWIYRTLSNKRSVILFRPISNAIDQCADNINLNIKWWPQQYNPELQDRFERYEISIIEGIFTPTKKLHPLKPWTQMKKT